MKKDVFPLVLEVIKKHESGCKSCVTAEINLDFRGEPSELVSIVLGHKKCCLRKIVLGSDLLHQRIFNPLVERTNSCGISMKHLIRK